MTTPIFTAADPILLQEPTAKSFGAVGVQDGTGRVFLLIKSEDHQWGLWEQVGDTIEARVVPLPGGKSEADASIVIHDHRITVYYCARLDDGSRPVHRCEVSAPGVRRMPNLDHVAAIYREIKLRTDRLVAVEQALRKLGETDGAALEGRVVALENIAAKVREALKQAGAVVGD